MANRFLSSAYDYLRIIVILTILVFESLAAILNLTIPWFLLASITLVFLALVNLVDIKSNQLNEWNQFSVLLFIAMILCSLGDFLMAGVFYITPIPLLNGVLMFSLAHVAYLLAMRNISPLLFRTSDASIRLDTRNLIVWIICLVTLLSLFFLTVFNPSSIELSVGILVYGIILVTVLASAITKWFEQYPVSFRISLPLGFALFLFSDWLIGVHTMTDPNFLAGPLVGITYIIGLLFIHITPLLGSRTVSMTG